MTVSKGFLPEHHSSGEEAEEGLKWIAKEEARTALHNHPCITWFLVAMAGAEALEHNAVVSSALIDIAPKLKGMLSEEDWDEVVYELDWFEHPITEMTANIAVSGSLSKLEEECNVDTTKARRLLVEGVDAIEAGRTAISRQKFIDLKMELLSLAEKREKE